MHAQGSNPRQVIEHLAWPVNWIGILPCTKFMRYKAAHPSDSQVMQNDFLLVIYFWACLDPTRPGLWLILWQKTRLLKHYSRLLCHTSSHDLQPGQCMAQNQSNHPWKLSSYVMSLRLVAMLPSFHPNQGLWCQVNVRPGSRLPGYHF